MSTGWVEAPVADWGLESIVATDTVFEMIVAGLTAEQEAPEQRIIVLVEIPSYVDPMKELTYGCRFAVNVGDSVRCPPMPLRPEWQTGVVVRLGDNGYTGLVKYVEPVS